MRISDWSSDVCSSDLLGPRLLRWLNRKGSGIATPGAVIAERAKRAQRIACGADCRAQIHHRLRKIPGARIGRDPVRSSAYISPPLRQRDRNREQSRYNPLDIGVNHHRPLSKGDGGDGGSGIGANARKLQQLRFTLRKATTIFRSEEHTSELQ